MKKNIIIVMLCIIPVAGFYILRGNSQDSHRASNEPGGQEKIRIATCPTYYEVGENMNTEEYEVIKTASTAESLSLINNDEVNMILAGRMLKPEEPQLLFEISGVGYSFISDKELSIQEEEIAAYNFYTDLSSNYIIDTFSHMISDNVSEVENIYSYLDQGIGITSAENTDYSRGNLVHIYNRDGTRLSFSRTPILYYSDPSHEYEAKNIIAQIRSHYELE